MLLTLMLSIIWTLHAYITCCYWEITFSSLFIYYPGRETHNNKVIATTNILLLVTTVALVGIWWQIHCTISRVPCKAALQCLCASASGLQGYKFVKSMLLACNLLYNTPCNSTSKP